MSVVLAIHDLHAADERDIGDALLYDENTPLLMEVIAKLLRTGCHTAIPALEYLRTARFAQDMREIAQDERSVGSTEIRESLAQTLAALQGLINTLEPACVVVEAKGSGLTIEDSATGQRSTFHGEAHRD